LQRVQVKQMLQQWERESPGRIDTIFRSLKNVSESHLADPALYDFAALEEQRSPTMPEDQQSEDGPLPWELD
jgi:tRNA 2-thiocytidine biosynthesis protein TtcA